MSDDSSKKIEQYISAGGILGFFTVLLIMTLNADNGKDLLDVTVAYIQALTLSLGK